MSTDPDLGRITEARFAEAFSTRALVDKRTAAALIGLDVKTLDALSDAQVIRAVRKGVRRAYTERDLRRFILEGPDTTCAPPAANDPAPKAKAKAPSSNIRRVNFSEMSRGRR